VRTLADCGFFGNLFVLVLGLRDCCGLLPPVQSHGATVMRWCVMGE